jgi:FAD/FMN-containing dehydrogenase/Fe-S oxidoreductase
MIPRLAEEHGLPALYREFLKELGASGFLGDIHTDYAQRLLAATDNSVYQLVPQAVVFPRDRQDVIRLMRLLGEPRFRGVKLSPRGGGTGTNGQSLTDGVIADLSRHMNAILELDLERGFVRVQPGVVLDQLNEFLRPHGVFFAPNLSPSNRATIGGMIATDACGKGSRVYGKTSNHLQALDMVFIGGASWTSRTLDEQALEEVKKRDDVIGRVHREIDDVVTTKRELIAAQFPKLQRFLTGYNLAHVRASTDAFNMNAIVAGSEGTLTLVTEAQLKLTRLPRFKKLIAIKYATFDDALASAQVLVAADPGAIETIDEKILRLAREDAVWHRVRHLLDDAPGEVTRAINLVEFESDELAVVEGKMAALVERIETHRGLPHEAIGYAVAQVAGEAAALWELRKKGVGLLGNAKGDRRPVPFVEDTAVPPERLAEFIREFRALLESAGLQYGMFGHVDVGCLHVRPALNLRDPADEKLLRQISDRVVDLVQKYGGVMWSEHGKGFRSEYSPRFFGEELYGDLRRIKAAFDPHNQLNPGKLAVPAGRSEKLVSVDALKRGQLDRQIAPASLQRYDVTVNCNGNAACFTYDPDAVMCPSTKVTKDRVHSPKGRASVMREWLRQMTLSGYDAAAAANSHSSGAVIDRLTNTIERRRGRYDFSHEVYVAMDGCLSCKACATQCPIKVDVPRFKSEFLNAYHSRYLRPLKDYFVAALEWVLFVLALAPRMMNWFFRAVWFQRLLSRFVGIVDSPTLSEKSVKQGLRQRRAPRFDVDRLMRLSSEQKQRSVVLVQDAFSTFYESNVTLATYDLLTELGYDVYVMPYRPNGKALHVKGFSAAFNRVVRDNSEHLRRVAATGIPLVGIDPAVTLTYRDEYVHVHGREAIGYRVHLLQEWLVSESARIEGVLKDKHYSSSGERFSLMGHCTERTLEPGSQKKWQDVFAAFGLHLDLVPTGCCGMSGVYGHEASHYEESKGLYAMSWARHLGKVPADAAPTRFLAQGHSCRSQVKRFGGFVPRHPAEALVSALRNAAAP